MTLVRKRMCATLCTTMLLSAVLGPAPAALAADPDDAFVAAVAAGLGQRWQGSQAIVVRADSEDAPGATMWLFERVNGAWRVALGPWRANVGANGVSKAAEGDKRAPSGAFLLGSAFGRVAAPKGVTWPYRRTDSKDRWVDDTASPFYNSWVRSGAAAAGGGEALSKQSVYKYGIVVHYNDDQTPGAGSAIFMHVWSGQGAGTLGCTAISEANLIKTLRWLRYDKRPVLVQGTQEQILALMQKDWGMRPLPAGWGYVDDFIPDAQIDLRYATANNFTGAQLPGYEAAVAVLRTDAIAALRRVADKLRAKGYGLIVYDAYRPPQAVAAMEAWAKNEDSSTKAQYYPDIAAKASLLKGYISTRSTHTAGGTVDVSLVRWSTGKAVDMGGSFDFFGARSQYGFKKLNKSQTANRKLLRTTFSAAGFQPYNAEWWHFSKAQRGNGAFALGSRQALAD